MKILVIQTAFIGDVVLTTPLLAAVRARFAGAEVHVVATPQGCEMLAGLGGVTCHALDKRRAGLRAGLARVKESLEAVGTFDLVLCVHRSARSLWLGRRVPAKRRVAFASLLARALGYETVVYPAYDEAIHYADKPLALLKKVAGPVSRPELALGVSREDESGARALTGGLAPRGYIVLSPFSVWGTKMWFADRFARLGAELARRYRLPVVVIGSRDPREIVISQTIIEKIAAAGGSGVTLAGRTNLGQLKAIIRDARLCVANDSAPVHVAAAFNVPTVAIFGPTAKKWGFFPLSARSRVVERPNLECRPCHLHGPQKCPRGHFKCMDEIQVEDVAKAVESIID